MVDGPQIVLAVGQMLAKYIPEFLGVPDWQQIVNDAYATVKARKSDVNLGKAIKQYFGKVRGGGTVPAWRSATVVVVLSDPLAHARRGCLLLLHAPPAADYASRALEEEEAGREGLAKGPAGGRPGWRQ